MRFLIDFCSVNSIEKSLVFPLLNCSKHEASILREIVALYMRGENEIDIQTFLEQKYYAKGFEILPVFERVFTFNKAWLVSHTR